MAKLKEYRVLEAHETENPKKSPIENLQEQVNFHLQEEWSLVGGVVVNHDGSYVYQAVAR